MAPELLKAGSSNVPYNDKVTLLFLLSLFLSHLLLLLHLLLQIEPLYT